jgi:DNA mismatch endonuclease (patch repair protein)
MQAITPGRSRNMAAIRSTGNATTELRLASALRRAGLSGWRRHQALLGKPDFVWPAHRLAVFVDGCFWHGCPRCYQLPRHNAGYWAAKVHRNRTRDRIVSRELRKKGWTVIRLWECQLSRRAGLIRIGAALHRPPSIAV